MSQSPVVVFDLDGTLIDSAPDLHLAANRLLAEEGQPALELHDIKEMVGEGVFRLVERVFRAVDIELSAAALSQYTERFRALYLDDPCRLTTMMPGARGCVERLQGLGYRLALCTNKPIAHTQIILEHFDLRRRFVAVVGGDTLPVRKPDPAPLRYAIETAAGVDAPSVFVGDSETDAKTGRAAAVPVVLVEGGYARRPIRTMDADRHVPHLDDVVAAARELAPLT